MSDEELQVLKELNERQRREEERLEREEKKKAATLKSNQQVLVGCLVGFVVMILIGLGTCSYIALELTRETPESKAAAEERMRCGSEFDAYFFSTKAVRRKLRSPATADFPVDLKSSEVRIEQLECGKWRVDAWVDAMNGFGAILRHRYTAIMVHDAKDDSWRGEVEFEDDEEE